MSPLGTIVVGNSSVVSSGSSTTKIPYNPFPVGGNEPLLRLMSLSLVNNHHHPGGPTASAAATFFSNLHCTAAAAAAVTAAMQFKSPVGPISREEVNASPETTATTNDDDDDEDEVLSIGREDPDEQQMVMDDDSCCNDKDDLEDDDRLSDRTTECLDSMEEQVISPPASITSDSSHSHSQHKRHNSAESDHKNDNFGSTAAAAAAAAARESLMFSIANILRPDFGQPPPTQQQQFSPPPPRPITNPVYHPQHPLTHHPLFKLNQQSEALLRNKSSSHHKLPRHNHPHQHRKPENPIDLSSRHPSELRKSSELNRTTNGSNSRNSPEKSQKRGHDRERKQVPSSPVKLMTNEGSKGDVNNKEENKPVDTKNNNNSNLWPAWVYCTRYSDRPSSGPRTRRTRKKEKEVDEKRPRTAFTADQLQRLKREFDENRYLTEKRRQDLARELRLHENQIKIWFQNKRAKLKKASGQRGGLALQLMAQGLYNHSTIPPKTDGEGSADESD